MSSWLPNPFKSLHQLPAPAADDDDEDFAGNVKEDLSVIGATIGRQLRGVAAFLAPPPLPSPPPADEEEDSGDTRSPRIAGIRNDLAEIGGTLKSSLSLLSSNKAVAEISKLASNLLQLNDEEVAGEEEEVGIGVTDEVVDFVAAICDRPEYWTEFPLSVNGDDFAMSDAQAEHVSVMEELVPSLADLRTKLSGDLSVKQFWMIYFIMLLPRLDENSFNLLSTPEIVEARRTLLTKLQHKRNLAAPDSAKDHIDDRSQSDSKCDKKGDGEYASGKNIVVAGNSEASGSRQTDIQKSAETSSAKGAKADSGDALMHLQNEDDISFSDLEDDDTDLSTRRYGGSGHGQGHDTGSSSPDGSSDWVRLNESAESGRRRSRGGQPSSQNRDSEGDESSDWLTIDELDNYN